MKKKHYAYDWFCDICGRIISTSCGVKIPPQSCVLCGKEICEECKRVICSKVQPTQTSGGPSIWVWGTTGTSCCYHKEELVICKSCTDTLKLTLQVVARKRVK